MNRSYRGTTIRYRPRIHPLLRMLAVLVMLTGLSAPLASITTVLAAGPTITSVSLTGGSGTAQVGATLFARTGALLTLTVSAANTQCIHVTDGATSTDKSSSAGGPFVITGVPPLVAAGSGVVTLTITPRPSFNGQGNCTGNGGSTATVSYTLDNTSPTVTGSLSPAPNGAGWNNSNVTITWSATDSDSGFVTNCPTTTNPNPNPCTDSVITETTVVTKTATATDRVGNSGTGSVNVKLDKTPPTITGSRSPAANANGWNNTNVTVSFTCSDALSGIKTCPTATTLSSEGANQSVSGTAVDVADNSSSTTVSGINIDKTPPTLTGSPTTSPNGAGWYNTDVAIKWTCSDALSGINGSCPANSTITGEGNNLTAAASVSDKAGNTTNATSQAVNIDRTPPVTTASAPPAWNNTDVTVALNANDALSGVAATYYTLDGGAQTQGTSVSISSQGTHTLTYWSVDVAGNVETTHSMTVKIDKTPPTISHNQSPAANGNGWNNSDVTVTFICNDDFSGVASCTSPQTVTTEGKNQKVIGTATDNAGNTATDQTSVSIDKTKPTISGSRSPAANSSGWNNSDVTVSFTCADNSGGSGIDTCTQPITLGEGANQSVTGTAVDAAGNSASTTESGINVDETPPTLTGAPITPQSGPGWYNTDVAIQWTCNDALSGIPGGTCPANSTIKGEGQNLTATASVSDTAGNTTVATSQPVNIDRTAPTTTDNAPLGWQNNTVTVSLIATDNLSGVAATYYSLDGGAQQQGTSVTISAEGVHTLTYYSVDVAGNVEATHSATIEIDKTSPTVTHTQTPAANGNGWNNTDVTVNFTCNDSLSGVASCTAPQTVTTEGGAQLVQGIGVDKAGNSANDNAYVSIDKTPPTISAAADRPANSNGWYKADVTVAFTCGDTLSGVASCPAPKTLGEGANQSAAGTALDLAGNSATASVAGINVDESAPLLAGAPTSLPNANGWYNGDVTIGWSCSDPKLVDGSAGSGIDGACPANSTITGEGNNLTAGASVSDKAGNTTNATSQPAVNIDRTPPVTTASAPSAWVNSDVTVTLDAFDALSGVAATHYILDGGTQQTGTTVNITSEGTHSLEFWSVDKAGNEEHHKTIQIKIDKTAPTISHAQSPLANLNGWNNSDVTVTFTCSDPALADGTSSGIASCTAPQTVSTEGQSQMVSGMAADNAGNTASDTASVSIDKTPPTISGAPDRAANANNWYKNDVTVSFTCADALSGVDTCTQPVTLGEGANQSVKGSATDAAGNSASTTVSGINIDETPPTLTGASVNADGTSRSPNANGWYNSDMTIRWSCSDLLSGIDGSCPADSTVTGEGDALSASASVSDKAGNTTDTTVNGIKIDRTPPTTTADAPNGWQNSDVTVTLHASDNLSGVAATYYSLDGSAPLNGTTIQISTQGTHTLTFWSVDKADNIEGQHSIQILIDETPPTITHSQDPAANSNGWNNTDVTVSFTCADPPLADGTKSGLASCTPPQKVTTEGKDQPVTGEATDNAGNLASDFTTVSIDKTPPTISGAPDRAPNANGWYNGDVTVSFTCGDTLSGVASCPGPKTLGEGANQSVTATAFDLAGNSWDATVKGINIDETPPLLSGAATSQPNANGWYKGDVTITWTCSDPLSGIDGDCPPDSTITGEGSDLSASASVSDRAGNQQNATVDGIHIDRSPPQTTASAPSGWINSDATITLTAFDALSGVAATYYTVDGGAKQTGTTITIGTEGTHTIKYWSVDNADNVENVNTVVVMIDKTAPTISHMQDPLPNGAGWNNTDVKVTFFCVDPALSDGTSSGIASCTPPQTVSTEGKDQPVLGTATDNAGNTASDTASVSIDKTPPTITGAPDRPANGFGWYNAPVTVSFTCDDALSHVAVCSSAATLADDGTNQSATGTATDAAGNSANTTVSGINIDQTSPILTGAPVNADGTPRSPNGDGWYNSDVTIAWTCSDPKLADGSAGSGIASCPANSTITGEGTNLTASATVSDKAGNPTNATVNGIQIDRTPPTTTADAPNGWQNSDVTVNLTAKDNLSGVAATHYALDGGATQTGTSLTISAEGTHTVQFWSVDHAGNSETPQTVTVQIDKTPPTITHSQDPAPNANGWNNTDVTVSFTCADPALADGTKSGLANCTPPQKVTTEGIQSVAGVATDNAGNTAGDVATVSIDKTPPTISGAPDRAANGNNWYKDDVTVSFTCNDSGSGIATCPPPKTLGEGANQSVTGTAFDLAGNSQDATVSGINIDKTPPVLSGAPTSPPNANGWYNTDVTVHWTCSDALSGIDGACPNDTIVTGEDNNLSATATVFDKAGNGTSATVGGIKIDRHPPITTAAAPTSWVNTGVTVLLTAADNLSGVAATYYTVDGGPQQSGTSVEVSTEGIHTLQYWSVDLAGNVEPVNTAIIKIDKTAPTISHNQLPVANAAGWNNGDVTVTFVCGDALSGIASCTTPQTVSTEGKDQPVLGTATDNAGNTANDTAKVSIDKTPPTISGAPDRAANANNWYKNDVTVSFTCADALSGIDTCTQPVTLGEGASQSVKGSATDAAGNSSSTTVSGINIDLTPPSLSGAPTTNPNGAGWYNGDVTIAWTCSDPKLADGSAGSGVVSCPGNSTITGEGASLSASATVSDKAGNSTNITVGGIKIDRTAPTTKDNAPLGWQNNTVTVSLVATDNLSGVAATYYSLDGGAQQQGTSVTISTDGVHTLTYNSVDVAGNAEIARSVKVLVDKTKPTITGAATTSPNANGWYNGPVTVHFTCSDPKLADGNPGSGVASCSSDTILGGNGANQSVTGTATDNAGNTASFTVSGINIDTTGPSITINGVQNGGVYTLGNVPTPSCTAMDALSGAGPCTGTLSGGTANGVGTFTYTATATDKAGNTSTVSWTFRVIYRWDGFLQPINDTAHQIGLSTSIFKDGSTVSVKLQLKRFDGTVVQANTAPMWLTPVKGSSTSAAVDESVYTASVSSGSSYRWDAAGQQYIYNWSTAGLAAGFYYRIGVQLDDGQKYYVNIGLR